MENQPRLPGDPMPAEIEHLRHCDRRELAKRWTEIFGEKPRNSVPPSVMAMRIAYELQARKYGGLKASLRKRLLQAAEPRATAPRTELTPGTVLIREWQGVNHTVTILDKGVSYAGRLYRSLSQVAGAITGNHWSGPVFFGLRSRRVAAKHD